MKGDWQSENKWITSLEGMKHPNEESSWHLSRLEIFRNVVEDVFKKKFSLDHKIEWSEINSSDIRITIISKDWGIVSTNLKKDWILSPNVPKDLPLQLLTAFEKKFKLKRERLKKTL